MRALAHILAAGVLLLSSCAAPTRPQEGAGAAHVGAPRIPMDAAVTDRAPGEEGDTKDRGPIRMPERIVLPASYRLMLLDGHMALVRETDSQELEPSPASMRIVTGEIARGELAYQPGLLPQELAAEVAANRESSARMDNALEAVMKRSRELSGQAQELEAQSRKLAEMLSSAQAKVQELEAAAHATAAGPPAAIPEPKRRED